MRLEATWSFYFKGGQVGSWAGGWWLQNSSGNPSPGTRSQPQRLCKNESISNSRISDDFKAMQNRDRQGRIWLQNI